MLECLLFIVCAQLKSLTKTRQVEQAFKKPNQDRPYMDASYSFLRLDPSGKTEWGTVVDYRKVNELTIEDNYPTPNITDVSDELGRCQ